MKQSITKLSKTLVLCAFLSLCVFASIPQAQATSLEKFPTSTSVIVAGWNNPTYAYSNNGQCAITSTANAQQEYSGFGFNLNATDTVDSVAVYIEFLAYCDANLLAFLSILDLNLRVYDGSSWLTYYYFQLLLSTDGIGFASADDNIYVGRAMSVLNHVSTPSEVNALKVRLQALNTGSDPLTTFSLSVDYVSVQVTYTPEPGKSAGWLLAGAAIFVMCLVPVAFIAVKKL